MNKRALQRRALYIDRDGGPKLFATMLQASTEPRSDIGVVFFHAFGEERQKTYRSTYLFAKQLAESGISSFRFDCTGIGDSEGRLQETTVARMCDESVYATEVGRNLMGVDEVIIIGIRMGAAIAVRSASRISNLRACVLWNPVTNGAKYFRELMRTEMIINLARKKEEPAVAPTARDSSLTEVDAEMLTRDFTDQINSIDLLEESFVIRRILVTARADSKREINDARKFVKHARSLGSDIEFWHEERGEFWTARSMHDAFYPTATFDATIYWLSNQNGGLSA